MSQKMVLRLTAVLAILILVAQPASAQRVVRPIFFPFPWVFPYGGYLFGGYPFGGYPYGGYPFQPMMTAGYGYPSAVYTPAINYYATYNYSVPMIITPGYGASSSDRSRVRSDLPPALAVPADSELLLAAWNAPAEGNRAAVVFVVPDANATIWVEGLVTPQTGKIRRFVTPPLAPKKLYEYDVRAQWMDTNGQWQSQSQTVQVRAGEVANVVFANKTP